MDPGPTTGLHTVHLSKSPKRSFFPKGTALCELESALQAGQDDPAWQRKVYQRTEEAHAVDAVRQAGKPNLYTLPFSHKAVSLSSTAVHMFCRVAPLAHAVAKIAVAPVIHVVACGCAIDLWKRFQNDRCKYTFKSQCKGL